MTYLVEHYWPGVTAAKLRAAAAAVRSAADEMAEEGNAVRYLHLTLVPRDETALCLVAAASAEFVEEAYTRAGVPFERIVGALVMDCAVKHRV